MVPLNVRDENSAIGTSGWLVRRSTTTNATSSAAPANGEQPRRLAEPERQPGQRQRAEHGAGEVQATGGVRIARLGDVARRRR